MKKITQIPAHTQSYIGMPISGHSSGLIGGFGGFVCTDAPVREWAMAAAVAAGPQVWSPPIS